MNRIKLHKNFKLNGKPFVTDGEVLIFSKDKYPDLYPFLKDWFDDTLTVKVKTSGSTGKPKTIELKKEYMVNSARTTGVFFNLPENTTALLCLSPDYIAGKMMLVRALVLGWQLDVVTPSSYPLIDIKKNYDFSAMVPLQLENSLKELHRIKTVIVGGAPISTSLLERIQHVHTNVFATYGMTETSTHIAVKALNNEGVSVSYQMLPNISISKDHRSCLVIKASKLSDISIITNDIVEILSEKEFKWLGRFDNVINSGGVKLIPEQIERKLATIIDYRFFVMGVSDEQLGEKMVLVVEIQGSRFKTQELKFMVESLTSLHKFEVPKEIYTVKKFIETETKKINRKLTIDKVRTQFT